MWETKRKWDRNNSKPCPGPSPDHMRGCVEGPGPKQQSCFQIHAGSITWAMQTPLYNPVYVRIATEEHSAFIRGRRGVGVYIFLEGRKSTILCQKLNFLISAGVQGFEPFHNMNSLSCSTRSKTFHNASFFHKVTLKSLPCSKHLESFFP